MAARAIEPSQAAIRQRAEQLAATLPPLLVAAERVAATVAQGVHGRRRVGIGETFWQFRRYEPGDAASAIDWRQSAKTQRVFVRENEWEAAESVWLWRDGSASMNFGSSFAEGEKIERATLLVLAVAALLVRGGERIALLGRDRVPSSGRAALTRLTAGLLAADGSLKVPETPSLPDPERLPRYAQVVMVGDFLSPLAEIDAAVKGFAGNGVKGHLLQVLDPAEEDLPYDGRNEFHGFEGEGAIAIGRAEGVRGDFKRRMKVRRDELLALARAAGWSYACHRTDRPPETALLALYGALAGGLG
jgi:uncharacterized protein (DUF58 family)